VCQTNNLPRRASIGAGKSGLLLVGAQGFGEIVNLDDRHNQPQKRTKRAKGEIILRFLRLLAAFTA